MKPETHEEIASSITRPVAELRYYQGQLERVYNTLLGSFNEAFEVYDSFYNIQLMDKSVLRRAAEARGKIDAITFLIEGEVPVPVDIHALKSAKTSDALVRQVDEEIKTMARGKHEYSSKTTQVDYRRGWRHALRYAFDEEERPWGHSEYDKPLGETMVA